MRIKQGSVVFVDFSYSNLKEAKFRPALVISNSEYNEESVDIEPSYIKIDSLYTVEKNIVRKVVARLKEGKIKEIRQQLLELIS